MKEGSDEMESGGPKESRRTRTIKVEENLTTSDMRETDLASPPSKRGDCRVHWRLLSLNLSEQDLMSPELGLELHLITQIMCLR